MAGTSRANALRRTWFFNVLGWQEDMMTNLLMSWRGLEMQTCHSLDGHSLSIATESSWLISPWGMDGFKICANWLCPISLLMLTLLEQWHEGMMKNQKHPRQKWSPNYFIHKGMYLWYIQLEQSCKQGYKFWFSGRSIRLVKGYTGLCIFPSTRSRVCIVNQSKSHSWRRSSPVLRHLKIIF